ncbi:MAG TPA: ParA family protein [Blastocatellia bacterium]|nr:ParA family protein [Blastocatellia bacterium]
MRRLQIQNFKGGVGKSTTAVTVAHGLALKGRKVLLVDLDQQGNSADMLGIKINKQQPVLYNLLVEDLAYDQVSIEARPNLFLIASDKRTSVAENIIAGQPGRELMLKLRLQTLTGFDYVILDCPPALNVLHNNALLYSNELIIPVDMDRLALQGAKGILDSVAELARMFTERASISGILPTFIDKRTNITHQVLRVIEETYAGKVLPAVRSDAKLRQASSHGKTIFEYDPHSKGAEDYLAVVDSIVSQEEQQIEDLSHDAIKQAAAGA